MQFFHLCQRLHFAGVGFGVIQGKRAQNTVKLFLSIPAQIAPLQSHADRGARRLHRCHGVDLYAVQGELSAHDFVLGGDAYTLHVASARADIAQRTPDWHGKARRV